MYSNQVFVYRRPVELFRDEAWGGLGTKSKTNETFVSIESRSLHVALIEFHHHNFYYKSGPHKKHVAFQHPMPHA